MLARFKMFTGLVVILISGIVNTINMQNKVTESEDIWFDHIVLIVQMPQSLTTYSVGPPSTRQRNAIQMAFRWRADGGLFSDVYWVSGYTK